MISATKVVHIPIETLDFDDRAFVFRATLRTADLQAIIACQQAGWTKVEVADLMGLSQRQRQNLERLLTLPVPIQAAIDNPADHFGATHGLELSRLSRRYPRLDIPSWIARVNAERLSVSKMKREIGRAHRPTERPRLGSIFNDKATDRDKGVFRFDAVKVVIADLDHRSVLGVKRTGPQPRPR